MIGSAVENYQVVNLLGEGGMGIVYRAFDLKLERYVAIKILNVQSTSNPQFRERFKREARHQAKLTHPNIVPVYGFAEQSGILGIVMEYVEGETLEKMIERKGRLQPLESLYILKQILTGISYAHKKGFIHRDIKPSNIIISSDNDVKIMDFGISKSLNELKGITKAGTKIGTILYMSPEQIKTAQEPTVQSDIYSIGITFFEMLAGKTPFDSETEFEVMEAHLKKNVPKVSNTYNNIPAKIDSIIQKSVAKQLNKRYQSCEEFLSDVNDLISSHENASKHSKKNKLDSGRNTGKKEHSSKSRFYLFSLISIGIIAILVLYYLINVKEFTNNPENNETPHTFKKETKVKPSIIFKQIKLNNSSSLLSLSFITDSVGVGCGADGTIFKSTDMGKSWTFIQDSTFGNLHKVVFLSPAKGFIVGDDGLVLVTTDLGNTWKRIETTYNNSLFNISFADDNTGFIIGTFGFILKTTNGGDDWKKMPSGTTENLFGIDVNRKNNNLFIVGWNGQLLKSTNLGENWSINKLITQKYLRSIHLYDQNNGFAVGGGGVILRTNDAGSSWEKVNTSIYSGLMKVKFKDTFEGVILGSKGEVLFTKDGGNSWEIIPTGIFNSLTDIVFHQNKIFVTGYNGTLLNN